MKKYELIVIDLDGTLIDSNACWAKIDSDFLAKRNLPMPDDYLANLSKLGMEKGAIYTKELFNLEESPEEIEAEWKRDALEEYAHRIKEKEDGIKALDYLYKQGFRLVVGTMNSREYFMPTLKRLDIEKYFSAIYSADNQKFSKSDKGFFQEILDKENIEANKVLVIDDLFDASKSAKAAGMDVMFMQDSVATNHKEEILQVADYYVDHWSQVIDLFSHEEK